jgi:hypothetical protein
VLFSLISLTAVLFGSMSKPSFIHINNFKFRSQRLCPRICQTNGPFFEWNMQEFLRTEVQICSVQK